MKTTLVEYRSQLNEIVSLISQGIECWQKAGVLLCNMIDEDPSVVERICEEQKILSEDVLRTLERIGRKQLVPELMLKDGPGWERLRKMPADIQRRYLGAPVELLIVTENGTDSLKVDVENLTAKQARQVFAEAGHVRDLGAQRAWMESQKPAFPEPEDARKPYSVHGRNLVITRPCKMTLQEIGIILAEMKA